MNAQTWRISLRTLARDRGFSIGAIVTLAFGIGANALVFSILNMALLHPLPYPHPGRLIEIIRMNQQSGEPTINASIPDVVQIQAQARGLESVAYYRYSGLHVDLRSGATISILAPQVSPAFFKVLGITPFLKRQWPVDEKSLEEQQCLVLSYSFWKTYLGSNPSVIGTTFSTDGKSSLVIGIMPAVFKYPDPNVGAWVIKPTESDSADTRNIVDSFVIARLQAGVRLSNVQEQLNTIAGHLEQGYPEDRGFGFRAVSLQAETVGPVKTILLILFGAVGLVLLAACANVSILLLARNSQRQGEIATRVALGASRYQIILQLLAENFILSFAGGVLGLSMAMAGVPIVRSLAPTDIPRITELAVNINVLGFTMLMSFLAVILFGLIPAIRISDINLSQALRGEALPRLGPGYFRLQRVLTILQVAVALITVISAGMLLKSLSKAMAVRLGFDPHNLLVVTLDESQLLPRELNKRNVHYDQLLNEVSSVPGVQAAALVFEPPFRSGGLMTSFGFIGTSNPGGKKSEKGQSISRNHGNDRQVEFDVITSSYFSVLRTVVVRGRAFDHGDTSTAPRVAIVNQVAANLFWPTHSPIGTRVDIGGNSCEIVGMVQDMRQGFEDHPTPEFYLPFDQANTSANGYTLVVRTKHGSAQLNRAVVSAVSSVEYENVPSAVTMDDVISGSLIAPRFHAGLMSLFALLTLVLAGSGIFGTLSYSVSLRTHEIGIRMALGAQRHYIFKSFLKQGLAVVLLGCCAGLVGALFLTRTMASLLYDVTSSDPATFIIATALLISVAVIACYVPAVRAMRVDVMSALRHE